MATAGSSQVTLYDKSLTCAQLFDHFRRPVAYIAFTGELSDIIFFQTDADYSSKSVDANFDGAEAPVVECGEEPKKKLTEIAVIRLYGVTKDERSVLVNVNGFFPYFYIEKPEGFTEAHIPPLMDMMNHYLIEQGIFKKSLKYVIGISIVERTPLFLYQPNVSNKFLKITTTLPRMVPLLRKFVESGIALPGAVSSETGDFGKPIAFSTTVYEANLPFVLRFLLDRGIVGGQWLKIPAGKYELNYGKAASHCSMELYTDVDDIIPLPVEGEWQNIGPIRILSFDLECVKFQGTGFPMAQKDPIIQISSIVHTHGQPPEKDKKLVFTLKRCDPLHSAHVYCFNDEEDLLLAWAEFFRCVDPDFITGFNIINFDIPYIINRAEALGLTTVSQLPRIVWQNTSVKDNISTNNILGTYENKEISMDGRIIFDVYDLVRRDYRLKSYTLNSVSFEFLKQQKEDVHYSTIAKLQRGTPADRRRIASYCLKDALLPLLLIDKLLLLYNYVEMARVTGTPIKMLITRGQQIRVTMQVYRQCMKLGYAIPVLNTGGRTANQEAAYEGGTVMEPIKGYHQLPVAVLDFQSLYPSIMIAHNLCYSTLIPTKDVENYALENVTRVPGNENLCFIKSNIRKGVLPIIVEELINARKKAKQDMANCTDPMLRSVYDGRQLALKITTNSVYGYTGASSGGFLPCVEVATAITSFGRFMIMDTKEFVEERYNVKNGYEHDAKVVYGDTDSVMIKFGTTDLQKAIDLGIEAAGYITERAIKPVNLVFEKVYRPLLLLTKKRYAGLYYTNAETYDKVDCKGIETVRRDFCLLVQQMMERVLHLLLVDLDLDGAIAYIKEKITELLKNEIDISLLVVTKTMGKVEYDMRLPHVELAKKLKQRDPGTAPGVGDRVSYLIIKGSRGQQQFERAEDPLYVVENNLAIDTYHYLDAVKTTLMRILEVITPNPEALFSGDHTRFISMGSSKESALSKFMQKVERCLGCKAVIKKPPFCDHCDATKQKQVHLQKLAEQRAKEEDYFQLWAQCQRCQGSLHNEVICDNRDCPIFYKRVKTRKVLSQMAETNRVLHLEYTN